MTTASMPPLLDTHWIDFALQHFDPAFSLTRTLARIEAIRPETADVTTFVLRPGRRSRGFVPGQYVPVRVVLGGVVHERYYSPTSDPRDPRLAITMKRHPEGIVSRWFADRAAVGDIVELGPAAGDFVLPTPVPARLLFIAGGSGITAVASLLRAAVRARPDVDAILCYYARTADDFALAALLRDIAARHRHVRIHWLTEASSDDAPPAGRFAASHLRSWAPDFAERETFLCGPDGLMQAVARHWADAACSHRLRRESFAPIMEPMRTNDTTATVHFRRSHRTAESTAPTLLAIAEDAGLRPASGCRMGICRTCVCTKLDGVVRDRLTGTIDATPGSRIRLCVTEPLGPVTLDL